MRKYLTPLFATTTFLWISIGAYFLNKPFPISSEETVFAPNPDILLRQSVFYFLRGQVAPFTNAAFLPYLKNLSDSLQCGSSQSLLIRCFYEGTETDNNTDLGQLRADSIKSILVSMNAAPDLIETESVKISDKKNIPASGFYPAELTLTNNGSGMFPSANWYFKQNQTNFVHTPVIKEYVSCLRRFLSSASVNYKVYVTNISIDSEKKTVSAARLKYLEKYLEQEGLSPERFIFKIVNIKQSKTKNLLQNPHIVINLATP